MQQWLNEMFTSPQWSFTLFFGTLLLGIFGAVGNGCNIAALGAIATYSGTKDNKNKKDIWFTSLGFMIGTLLALALIGSLIGFLGQTAGKYIQTTGKFFAGIVLVFFGLITLDLFPVKIPSIKLPTKLQGTGLVGDILFGFALGSSTLACTLACCSPILPFILSMAAIEGSLLKSTSLMVVFGIGYTLPLMAILMGFSVSKFAFGAGKSMDIIKKVAGGLLIAIGFYFLFTI